jgi:diguanylate cyclase (GGDEF)-like protein
MLIFQRTHHRYSLRRNLLLLVVVCVLPAAVVSAALAYSLYEMRREQIEQQTALLGRSVLSDLERELATVESALKTLATSQELIQGDLAGFQRRATAALAPGIVYNYLLTDAQGRQVMNTLIPFGEPLPSRGTPPEFSRVFTDRVTVLSDIFSGPVVKKHVIALGVPVVVNDGVAYSLNVGIDPARMTALAQVPGLPQNWLVAVLDSAGQIAGRSRDAGRFVGEKAVPEVLSERKKSPEGRLQSVTKDGVPVFSAYTNSKRWGWSVVVGAPREDLGQAVMDQLALVLVGIVVAFSSGLWLARTISLRLLESVGQLNRAAISVRQGEDVQIPTLQMRETEAVLGAMVEAAQAMKQVRFLAQHDALTLLPNRLLFDEVADRAIALSERQGQTLALLALDLDGFKAVNDTLGHAAGDEVLKTVAQRILKAIRASDIAARIGGDEFILLLVDVGITQVMDTAQRIIALLSEPYEGIDVPVSASIGVALYPDSGHTLKVLAAAADQALYTAKASGKRRAVLAP